ncbi:MAG: DoxX family protein [Candidatus Methylomirabilales bacterium]
MSSLIAYDLGLFVMRLSGFYLALGHGLGKTIALASGQGAGFISSAEALGFPLPAVFAWVAALSELVGGILVGLGLATRIFTLFPLSTMFVAAFVRHRAHEHALVALGMRSVPPEVVEEWGNPELAIIYLICFAAVLFLGPGRISLDYLFKRKSVSRREFR